MKKLAILAMLGVAVMGLIGCASTLGAVLAQNALKYEPYKFDEFEDIYGTHVVEAVLIDQQNEGFAAVSIFDTRIMRETVDGVTERYFLQFREQENVNDHGNYSLSFSPIIRIDGVIYELERDTLLLQNINDSPYLQYFEATLSDEVVEALRHAESVMVQFYETFDSDKPIDLTPEGVAAAREFVNGKTSL